MPKGKRFKWRKPKPMQEQKTTDEKNAKDKEKSSDTKIVIRPRVQVDVVNDLRKQHKTEREEDAARDKKQLRWTKIAALLVFIYTGIMAYQAYLTRVALEDSSDQFHIDQRPYVWTNNVAPEITIQAGQRMWANISLINYGKSPALKARMVGKIFTGNAAKEQADQWFASHDNKPISADDSEVVIPPGIPGTRPTPDTTIGPTDPGKPKSETMGFGGGGFITLYGDDILSEPDVNYILNNDESAYIVARIQYFDAFGNYYWSNICYSRYVDTAIPSCKHHNEIH
jgi:hypothetical protein